MDNINNLVNTSAQSNQVANNQSSTDTNLDLMKKISENKQSFSDIEMLTSSKITDQLKVFLIAQARNELNRVLKLTKFLDRLETSFMDKVDSAIQSDSLTLRQYNDIINVTTSLLSRSNEIISKVLKDDSLTMIMNTTVYQTDTSSQTSSSVVANLKDPQSREKVRNVIQQILRNTNSYDSPIPTEGVEIEDAK